MVYSLRPASKGYIRSTDDGENWALVISEGGVGIDVERIKGGFAAITYSTQSKTRRIRTSYDGGKTWQPIDAGLPAQTLLTPISSINASNPALGIADSSWHPKELPLRCQSTKPLSRLVKTSFVVILTAFTGHPTREKHGNCYFLLQKVRCSNYLFQAM